MFGFRVHSWGSEPEWEQIRDPEPGPGEVLIDVEACSVGLTVLNCINGDLANDAELLPRVPGHELIGRVTAAGSGADTSLVGRRVAAYFYLVCGRCNACLGGNDPWCHNLAGWVGVHRDGGYAQKVVLPQRNAIPMPEQLDPISATVVPDAVATPVHVAAVAGIGEKDRVVVFGAGGGVGIHMIQVARHFGAAVAGFDIVEQKLETIEALDVLPVRSEDLGSVDPNAIFPNGAPTVVIDLLGTEDAIRWSIDGLAMGGRLVALTTFRDRPVPVESRELVFRELSLFGSRYSNRAEVSEAANLVASGAVRPIIGEVGGPDQVLSMHDRLRSGSLLGRGALDWNRV